MSSTRIDRASPASNRWCNLKVGSCDRSRGHKDRLSLADDLVQVSGYLEDATFKNGNEFQQLVVEKFKHLRRSSKQLPPEIL